MCYDNSPKHCRLFGAHRVSAHAVRHKTWLVIVVALVGCSDRVDWDSPQERVSSAFDDNRVGALALAAENGDVGEIDRLVREGVDVNTVGKHGVTPLLWALAAPTPEAFARLLQHNADPNVQMSDGSSPLSLAASRSEDVTWIELAIEYGGDPNLLDSRNKHIPYTTPLFDAIRTRNTPGVECLVEAGADVNHRNGRGETPLDYAVQFRYFEIVYVLLKAGADFRTENSFGRPIVDGIVDTSSHLLPDKESGVWRDECLEFLQTKGVDITQD